MGIDSACSLRTEREKKVETIQPLADKKERCETRKGKGKGYLRESTEVWFGGRTWDKKWDWGGQEGKRGKEGKRKVR